MWWLTSVLAGAIGTAFLSLIFSVARARWPHSYYAVGDLASYRISLHPARYIAFRFLPVALVTVLAGTTAEGVGGDPLITGFVLATLHISTTAGRATLRLLRDGRVFAREVQAIVHLLVSIGVLAAALVGGLLAGLDGAEEFVPTPSDIPLALWTAAFAGFSGAFLIQFTRRSTPEVQELLKQSRATVGEELWLAAEDASAAAGADPYLVKAILLVENLQRPPWVRRLERTKGRLFKRGTYGVMQVQSEGPVSDTESVRIAVHDRLLRKQVPIEYEARTEALQNILSAYNGDPRFIELATVFYEEIAPESEYRERWYEDFFEETAFVLAPVAAGFLLGALSTVIIFLRRRVRKE